MKHAFTQKPIGSVCQLLNGRAFKPTEWMDTGLPIVRIQNLNDGEKPFNFFDGEVADRHLINTGDVLLSWSGTPGTSFGCFVWDRGRAVLNQHIFKVAVDQSQIDTDYFVFAVNSKLDEMIAKAHGGVGLRHITKGKLEEITLPLPHDLTEQRRIVTRIKELIERIDEIRKLRIEVGIEIAALASSLIETHVKESWPVVLLNDLVTDVCNGWSGKEDDRGVEVGVLRLSCVHSLVIDTSDTRPVKVSERAMNQFHIDEDDVFVVRGNGSKHLVGRSAIAKKSESDVIFNDLLIRVRFNSRVLPEFGNLVLQSARVRRQIESSAKTAAGIWKINQTGLGAIGLPCPKPDVQKAFVERVNEMRRTAGEIVAEISATPVSSLIQSILRKAFAGEL